MPRLPLVAATVLLAAVALPRWVVVLAGAWLFVVALGLSLCVAAARGDAVGRDGRPLSPDGREDADHRRPRRAGRPARSGIGGAG